MNENNSEVNSNSHKNEMLQEAETNSLNNNAWVLFDRFRVKNLQKDFLPKLILLAILEPIDSKEQQHIQIELDILKQEFGEIFEAKLIDRKAYCICIDILNRYIKFRQNPEESLKNSILNEIFSILRVESYQSKLIENQINRLSIDQRSVLRYMVHQSIQAKIAFIRVTLKNKNYQRSEAEGYHCTRNPFYYKMKNNLEKKCKDINDKYNNLSSGHNKLGGEYNKLEDKYNKLKNQLRMEKENSKIKIKQLEKENKDFENEIIRKEAESAKREAMMYPAALGKATNVYWSDDTNNNSIQLTKDIQELEKNVDDLAKVKGRKYKINEEGALKLLQKYNIQIGTEDKKFKSILSFALQRLVVEFIFDIAKNLCDNLDKNDDDNLESNIIYHTEELVKYSSRLVNKRKGDDKISNVTPIKIRQQSYAMLALRGFVNDHHLIREQVNKLIKKMEQYRDIVDIEKQKEFRVETENLVRSGIQLYFFLKTQEPVPEIKWYELGNPIEKHAMKGHWEHGEERYLKQRTIKVESDILKQEFGEIFEAKLIDKLNRYIEFHQNSDKSLNNSILIKFFSILRVESDQIKPVENYLKRLSNDQRSIFRHMVHQSIEVKIALIRVTLKNKNYQRFIIEEYNELKTGLEAKYNELLSEYNNLRLTKDILKLEKNVDDLAKVKGRKYKINEEGALKLLQKYNIRIGPVFNFILKTQEPVPKIKWHELGNPFEEHQ
ncbi:10970_t:CDS:2 [Diversispora eburnea]|uniref:10970_t:CDS:1 n=1 Tax=Diversispora eburnea TaxID=1213867 RepID=A0A9N9CAY6_9GLOM|nr:10970_t:CDS:2 [Diversispora eburnea]